MLLRFAKIAGGLRAVVTEAGSIIATSVGLLSARSVAYFVGFTLGSIVSAWLPIIATLISIAGFFNAGSNTPECEAYRAQMRAIDAFNRALMASYQLTLAPYIAAANAYSLRYLNALKSLAPSYNSLEICRTHCAVDCSGAGPGSVCGFLCWGCMQDVSNQYYAAARAAAGSPPVPPPPPNFQTYPACSAPNCPPGKKVWTQVLWASPNGSFTEAKGCYIVAYSQDAPTLPAKIEYNPFLSKLFVESRALSYYLVNGDRYRGLNDSEWKNLESVSGWDKGYWRSEVTDPECRGWRPGWSRKVK
jgi:hypothetical protein